MIDNKHPENQYTKLTKPLASYAAFRKAGPLVYIAGQGCRNPLQNDEYVGLTYSPNGSILSYDVSVASQNPLWNDIPSTAGDVYQWDAEST